MVGDTPPRDASDDYDGLAALGYPSDSGAVDEADLAALVDYVPAGGYESDDSDDEDAAGAELYLVESPDTDEEGPGAAFAVTNPPGTVTVTAFLDGRIQQIELSPNVVGMTEADLADEIVVIAGLATMDARSAQYSFMLDGMREHGHSDVATRDFLARDLELPSPEQADARRAEVFATRYEDSHE
ncbi:YbaB/EbfC family DNA-binding protein [Mycobacterium manitobense]|uniref:YbaB/EbfC family DNA-binding protein n=1 Tax=[Mycobacterium] manitobense TaxID=190147 RepID=A0A9X3BYD5_9MYCO|nr:YbaB/EbfC family DNA-binding protein [[Mycobacterium] manitobense]MCV7171947.1 YbaB/EbfC family DNA-binding protein [[Mycobacterium] manitobense]